MKFYKEFTVTFEPFNVEAVSSLLWELNIDGINEEVNCVKVFAGEQSGVGINDITSQLQKLADEKLLIRFNVEEYLLEEKNWNEEWEKSINVIEVSDKLVIKPTFRDYSPKEGQIVITIDPKMSFGTGEHQTTKLVLNLTEKYLSPGSRVLDVGSGTAVLAIAAVKLGASGAVAVDNDEWCYDNGKENCALNGVEEKVEVRIGELKDVTKNNFDFIFANIQKNILLSISNGIRERIKEGGIVILSGLLYTDEKEITEGYSKLGFEILEIKKMDEWIAVVLRASK